jgi:hypothetical protein
LKISFAQLTVAFDMDEQPVLFGVSKIKEALQKSGRQLATERLSQNNTNADIIIRISPGKPIG